MFQYYNIATRQALFMPNICTGFRNFIYALTSDGK